ncbi:hypothetical protein [Sphingomonas sp. R86520]|uniref:hypothetical protein n=1 Tax=Sphingomonas sp. R86520 TaxID=3093859 RepID=UPI0036D3BBB7
MNEQALGLGNRNIARPRRPRAAIIPLDERWTVWTIWAVLLANFVREVLGQSMLVSFGFYTLHVVDPPVLMAIASTFIGLNYRRPRGGLILIPILLIAVIIIINLVRGLQANPAVALLWARVNMATGFLCLMATICPATHAVHAAIRKALVTTGIMVAVLGVARLLSSPDLFMTASYASVDDVNDGGRILTTHGGFHMGLAATLMLSDVLRRGVNKSPWQLLALFILVSVELASGQGTSTLAMFAMLTVVLTLERGSLSGTRLVIGGALLLAGIGSWVTIRSIDLTGIHIAGFDLGHRSDNLETREAIWSSLMRAWPKLDLYDQLFGLPGGQIPYLLVYRSNVLNQWTLQMHSMYYGALNIMGYVGYWCYVAILAILTFAAQLKSRRRSGNFTKPAYGIAMCVGTAILSYSYEMQNADIFGLFISIWWYGFPFATQNRSGSASPSEA